MLQLQRLMAFAAFSSGMPQLRVTNICLLNLAFANLDLANSIAEV